MEQKVHLEAGRNPSGGKRATYMDTTAFVHGQGSDRGADDLLRDSPQRQGGQSRGQSRCRLLATLLESLFNVKKDDRADAKAAVDFWQNFWTAEKREQGKRNTPRSFTKTINKLKKGKKQRGWDHSRYPGSAVRKTKK